MTFSSTNRNRTTNQIGPAPIRGARRKDDTVSKKNRESAVVSAEANNNQIVESMTTTELENLNQELQQAETPVQELVQEQLTPEQKEAQDEAEFQALVEAEKQAESETAPAIDPGIALNLDDNAKPPVADEKPAVPQKSEALAKFKGAEKFDRDQVCSCGNWYYYKSESEEIIEENVIQTKLIWVCSICGATSTRAVRPQPTSADRAVKMWEQYMAMAKKLDAKLMQVGDEALIEEYHSDFNQTLSDLASKPETYNRAMLNSARAELDLFLGEGWIAVRAKAKIA